MNIQRKLLLSKDRRSANNGLLSIGLLQIVMKIRRNGENKHNKFLNKNK
jgi:hypothetical protein